jgi:hypothetical protein
MKSLRQFSLAIILLVLTTTVLATRPYFSTDLYVSTSLYPTGVDDVTWIGDGILTSNLTTDNTFKPQCQVTDASGNPYYLFSGVDGSYYPIYPAGSW